MRVLELTQENITKLETGQAYAIQELKKGEWVELDYIPPEYNIAWPAEAWPIEKDSTNTWEVDWEWLYGELGPGEYRIEKEFYNYKEPGDWETMIVYADFTISRE